MEPVTTGLLAASVATSILGGISEAKAQKKAAQAQEAALKLQAGEFRRRADYNIKLQERQGQNQILNAAATRAVGVAGYTKENLELDYREFSTLEEIIYQAKVSADYEEKLILAGASVKGQEAANAYSGLFLSSASAILGTGYKYSVASGSSPSTASKGRAPAYVDSII